MAYEISKEFAELIVTDGYNKFLKFIEEVNDKARKGQLKIENAAAYLVGTYQKKGIIAKN